MTFTRLTLGEPRLRGKVHGGPVQPPCLVPIETGGQLILDQGFENWVTSMGTTEIPRNTGGNLVLPTAGTTVAEWSAGIKNPVSWFQLGPAFLFGGGSAWWTVSTTSPNSGSSHARVLMAGGVSRIYPTGYCHCRDITSSPFPTAERLFAVTAGLTVDASCWAKADNLGQQGYLRLYIQGYANDPEITFTGNLNAGGQPTLNFLTTGYAEYSESAIVPSGVDFVNVQYHVTVEQFPSPTANVTFDVDDAVWGIE